MRQEKRVFANNAAGRALKTSRSDRGALRGRVRGLIERLLIVGKNEDSYEANQLLIERFGRGVFRGRVEFLISELMLGIRQQIS